MKTKFVVKAIEDAYGSGVVLTLNKYRKSLPPLPPEPEPQPDINPLDTFVPETDEERVMLKVFKALDKFSGGLFPRKRSPSPRATRVSYTSPTAQVKLPLSKEEYDDLGKHGLRQMLELEIVKVKEDESS